MENGCLYPPRVFAILAVGITGSIAAYKQFTRQMAAEHLVGRPVMANERNQTWIASECLAGLEW